MSQGTSPTKIVLSLLTWNTRDISMESVAALAQEAAWLQQQGCAAFLVVCDNGSTDGTADALRAADAALEIPHRFLWNESNRGISVAGNQMLDVFQQVEGDFLLMMDGDIEIVPYSSLAMMRHLETSDHQLGCLGAHMKYHTRLREETAVALHNVSDYPVTDDRQTLWVAWTQYGLFRREVFEAGVRFDESGPFAGPGWGCEDVDLAFQMHSRGFYLQSFAGMVYLHRNLNSSIPSLQQQGVDAHTMFRARRDYVIKKWEGRNLGQETLDFLRRSEPQF